MVSPFDRNSWVGDAACLGADREAFFAHESQPELRHQAVAICRRCPVQEQCLAWALDNDERFGIWGGKTERERRDIRNAAIRAAASTTNAGGAAT